MNILKIITTVFAFLTIINLFAQQKQDTITSTITDTSIVVVENEVQVILSDNIDTTILTTSASEHTQKFNMLVKDSQVLVTLDNLLYEKFYKKNFFIVDTSGSSQISFKVDEIPTYPDSIYEQRIKALNIETPPECLVLPKYIFQCLKNR